MQTSNCTPHATCTEPPQWHPCIQSFHHLVSTDPKLSTLFSQMLPNPPAAPSTSYQPFATPPPTSLTHLCHLLNIHLTKPPPFISFLQPPPNPAHTALPLTEILSPLLNTTPALPFFLDPTINAAFRHILSARAEYLSSPASLDAFSPSEWASPRALAILQINLYQHPNPTIPGWGYPSWNAWFIRRFRPGLRPIAHPHDPRIITAPCEATPYALVRHVPLHGPPLMNLKGVHYALHDMFAADDALATPFEHGDVLQAFLDSTHYHRWHAPVSGKVVAVRRIQGSYFAVSQREGVDETGGCKSMAFMTYVATRMVLVIRGVGAVGLVAMVMIGMGECSSVVATVAVGDEVSKGGEVGYFQFGGSTYCLVVRKGVVEQWRDGVDVGATGKLGGGVVEVNSWLAQVKG